MAPGGEGEKNMIYCRWFSVFGLNRNHRVSFFASFSFFTENLFKMQPFQLEDKKKWRSFIYPRTLQSSSGESNLLVTLPRGVWILEVSNCVCLHRSELRCPLLANFCWFKSIRVTLCDNLSRSFEPNSFMRRLMVSWQKWHLGGKSNQSKQLSKTEDHRCSLRRLSPVPNQFSFYQNMRRSRVPSRGGAIKKLTRAPMASFHKHVSNVLRPLREKKNRRYF